MVLAQRKYCIYTSFLDTTLQKEGVPREGETDDDALIRMCKELDAVADKLRPATVEYGFIQQAGYQPPPSTATSSSPMPIIDRSSKEKLEIAIDNADSIETLGTLKEEASKHGLVSQYMNRLKQLTNG